MKVKITVWCFSIFTLFTLNACDDSSSLTNSNPPAPTHLAVPQTPDPVVAQTPDPVVAQTPVPTVVPEKPLALIYKGPGSCSLDQGDAGKSGYGCSEASADAATLAGFQYRFVGPKDLPENATTAQINAFFGKAKVWIQPGGVSNKAYFAMTASLRKAIVNFVSRGGGYVGFCAGAFLGTDWFNLLHAHATAYSYSPIRRDLNYTYLPIKWSGTLRTLYFEGGPYFSGLGDSVEVMANFEDGTVAAVRDTYGMGRVYLSGPHPEAPNIWGAEDGMSDPDGSDVFIAASMISWTALAQ